jgi:Asp/Glu/hydantoin racemase
VPLVGILRLAAGHLASLGESFAAVTRNRAIGDELRRRIDDYGLSHYLSSVELLDVDFCLVSDHTGWAGAMEPLVSSLSARGVTRLLNGCSAVEISDRHQGGVEVIDPTELAIQLLGVAFNTGLIGGTGK